MIRMIGRRVQPFDDIGYLCGEYPSQVAEAIADVQRRAAARAGAA